MARKGLAVLQVGLLVLGMLSAVLSVPAGTVEAPGPVPCPGKISSWKGSQTLRSDTPEPLSPCPGMEWVKTYDGPLAERGTSILPTADGGYVVLGEADTAVPGAQDVWVLKLNETGVVEWERTYGGPGRERPQEILATADGGYLVLSSTSSFGPNPSVNTMNAWIFKLDASGDILWQNAYGGTKQDLLFDIASTPDGGFIAAGGSDSHRTGSGYWWDVADAWVVKLDASGNVAWQKAYGVSATGECASGVQPTPDGGYIVAGSKVPSNGLPELWVFKVSSSGSIAWQKIYGVGYGGQLCAEFMANNPDVVTTPDGGYFVTAITLYNAYYATDGWIYKLDSAGNVVWRRGWGTSSEEWFVATDKTSDGGYVMVGVGRELGPNAIWVVRIDSASNLVWKKLYSMSGASAAVYGNGAVRQTSDGGFVLTGGWSSGGLLVMKLDGDGFAGVCTDPGIGVNSNAVLTESRRGPLGNNNAKAATPATSMTTASGTFAATSASVSQQCTSW